MKKLARMVSSQLEQQQTHTLLIGLLMKKRIGFLVLASLCIAYSPEAFARTPRARAVNCSKIVNLRTVSPSGRGGTIIWKSNWNSRAGREQTYGEGNHSQKGGAFLVYYRSALAPTSFTIDVRDTKCNIIAKMGRYPRCTPGFGCGEHERWYLRAPGSSMSPIPVVASKARKAGSNAILIPLRNGSFAKVQNVYDNREIAP